MIVNDDNDDDDDDDDDDKDKCGQRLRKTSNVDL